MAGPLASVEALLEIAPKTAAVKRGEHFAEVPVEEVKVGETVAVKSGMSIPLDGEIIAGESAINQAPITGESVPVDKKKGDVVFAGTVNGEGSLEIRVTKPASDTIVQQAQIPPGCGFHLVFGVRVFGSERTERRVWF